MNTIQLNQLRLPEQEKTGETYTLNDTGNVSPNLDAFSIEFAAHAKTAAHTLDVGCAFGMVALEAFQKGAKNYTALDMDARHVGITMERLKETNAEYMKNFTGIVGDFSTVDLPENFYDNVLIARVLHFFSPPDIIKAIEKLYKITAPGGKIYVITNTTYMKGYVLYPPI